MSDDAPNYAEWKNQILGRIRHSGDLLKSWHDDKYFGPEGCNLRGRIDGLYDALRLAKVFNLHKIKPAG